MARIFCIEEMLIMAPQGYAPLEPGDCMNVIYRPPN